MAEQKNDYCGYGLFNDVEDEQVKNYNRGRVLVNIMEDNSDGSNITQRGAALSAGYLLSIPPMERKAAYAEAETILKKKGTI